MKIPNMLSGASVALSFPLAADAATDGVSLGGAVRGIRS